MTDIKNAKLDINRVLSDFERLTRTQKKWSPSAPLIIPVMLIIVSLVGIVCVIIKLVQNCKANKNSKKYGIADNACSPDIGATPEDQTSMATTVSMRTREQLRHNSQRNKHRNRLPPVSLYQLKPKQSPSAASTTVAGGAASKQNKTNKAANKSVARIARQAANKSLVKDANNAQNQADRSDEASSGGNNADDNSLTNLSQHSGDTEDVQGNNNSSSVAAATYGANVGRDESLSQQQHHHQQQPEVHVVQIRDIDDIRHSEPVWPQTESEI